MLKTWLLFSAKILISIALIAWVFNAKDMDLESAVGRVLEMSPVMILPVIAAIMVQYVVCALRWRSVLGSIGASLRFRAALRLFYIGSFFNQVLPASVGGDAVRTYMAYRQGISLRRAINGVMLERVATVTGLVLLVAAVLPAFLPRVGAAEGAWMVPMVAIVLAVLVAGILFVTTLDRLPERFRRWRIVRGLAYLATDTRVLFFMPGPAFRALGWSAAGHANLALATYFIARGLDIDIGVLDCFALFLPVLLVTSMPISIAGWGVREGSMVYAFGLIGVPAESALVLSVLFGLFMLASALPGGLVWLASNARQGGGLKAVLDGAAVPSTDGE